MREMLIRGCSALLLTSLTACASVQDTADVAVNYNRSFAEARNEVLLLNILRTWAREPMQFSTMASVNGGLRTGSEITIPFTNIILGGEESISPSLRFTARNPNVTINPLGAREFMQGMARPASVDLIDSMVTQGWHRPTVLSLTIGGVTCSEDARLVKLNMGENAIEDRLFKRIMNNSDNFSKDVGEGEAVTLRMSGKEAAEFLARGAGEGRKISSVKPVSKSSKEVLVSVVSDAPVTVTGLDFRSVCGPSPADANEKWSVIPRSPQAMIFYLAELHRRHVQFEMERCDMPTAPISRTSVLFRVRVACAGFPTPAEAAVSTRFQGHTYYIPKAEAAGPGDHSLQTLSILAEFIALQTTEAAINAGRPIVAIPSQ